MGFSIFLGLLALWSVVYITSYAVYLFKNRQMAKGAFLLLLPLAVAAMGINFFLQIMR